jgi:uncharacterized membrane protein YidH (DUF202 family)
MAGNLDPALLRFTMDLAMYVLIAFGIMIAGAVVVYSVMVWKGNFSGPSIARILQQADIPKMTTIIMIIAAVSLLALLRIIAGEAAIALLSAIAGYVLGNRTAPAET